MSPSHHITPVEIHPDFNDPLNPWAPCRVGQAAPDFIAGFKPVSTAIPLTSECIQAEFGVCKCSVIYDFKHETFFVFLCDKEAVGTVVSEADKLPGYNVFAFDEGYEHYAETFVRIKDWIMQQAQDHVSHYDALSLAPEVLGDHALEGLTAFSNEDIDDHPKIHDDTSVLSPETFASQAAPLAELQGLISFSEEDPDDPPNLEHESTPPDEEDLELQGGSGSLLTPIQSATDPIYERHNQEVYNVLQTLVATGPTEIRERDELHQLLSRPPRTDYFDVQLEEALLQAVRDSRDIQRATGDETTFLETYGAILAAQQNLGFEPLPGVLGDQ